jgi:hypothetical protein
LNCPGRCLSKQSQSVMLYSTTISAPTVAFMRIWMKVPHWDMPPGALNCASLLATIRINSIIQWYA